MPLEHPMITQINRTGYPSGMEDDIQNMIQQPEHAGTDFYDTEVLEGDEIAIDKQNFDEVILKENVKRYLIENLNFIFRGGLVLDKNRMVPLDERLLEKYLHEVHGFEFKIAE